jgi:hypothetical protein
MVKGHWVEATKQCVWGGGGENWAGGRRRQRIGGGSDMGEVIAGCGLVENTDHVGAAGGDGVSSYLCWDRQYGCELLLGGGGGLCCLCVGARDVARTSHRVCELLVATSYCRNCSSPSCLCVVGAASAKTKVTGR